jgi:hypothetical protein
MHHNGQIARRVIFLFLDGVGLGSDERDVNPLVRADLPVLRALLDGQPLTAAAGQTATAMASMVPIDATLGVPGRPQSATGQATLLTGRNVPQEIGEHYGPKPNPAVQSVVQAGTLLSQLRDQQRTFSFVNAYPPRYFAAIDRGKHLLSVLPLAAVSAGQLLLTHADLFAGRAFSADFTNQGWRDHLGFSDAPVLTAAEAGRHLAHAAAGVDFTLFEHWLTDIHGHRQDLPAAVSNLETFDAFLGGLLEAADLDETLIIVTSDHGNVEDMTVRTHTMNPVPCLLIGAGHAALATRLHNLADVTPTVQAALALPTGTTAHFAKTKDDRPV